MDMMPSRASDASPNRSRVVRILAAVAAAWWLAWCAPWAPAYAQTPEAALPPPTLFDVGWDDLEDVLEDVQPAFRPEAATWRDAPIVHLDYVLATPTSLAGSVEIRWINRSSAAWPELWFHLLPNLLGGRFEVTELAVADASGFVPVEPSFERDGALLRVVLPSELEPGRGVVVRMEIALDIPSGPQRNYSLLSYRQGVLSLAHAYPLPAVHRNESGWDLDPPAPHGDLVFARSAWFRARLDAPAALELVATGMERVVATADDRRTWEVRAGPVRDLYLSLGAYRTRTDAVAGVEVTSHYLRGGELGGREALVYATRSLESFNARWTPYPYATFDIVPLATEALGVEFPGVIALATRLYDRQRSDLPWVVVHEVAHQWFYAIVGNDQITDPWLDEALAQYAVWAFTLERSGVREAEAVRQSFERRWSRADRETPVGRPVTAYSPAEYGSVVYGRGPLVILDLRERVGAGAFERFLRGYVSALRWGVSDPDAFITGLEAACGCALDDVVGTAIEGR